VRSTQPVTAAVTLSYLARGFDWAADYSATLSPDGKSLDLGAWVTLANGNGIGFASARTQVVAGKLNRESGDVVPVDAGAPILAQCWPRGSTSDSPAPLYIARASPYGFDSYRLESRYLEQRALVMAAAAPMQQVMVTAQRVEQEQLGDLKLYRVPERTTVASRQAKQVRLLDRTAVPVQTLYVTDLIGSQRVPWAPVQLFLRTKNDRAHGLGVPLPSGRVAVFATNGKTQILENEASLRDLAVDEDVEIGLGTRADVQFRAVEEATHIDPAHTAILPLVPGVSSLRSAQVDEAIRIEISNAKSSAIEFEVRLRLTDGTEIFRADHLVERKNGRTIFRLTVPAGGQETVRYQTRKTVSRVLDR
jgi:hypothetical protein